MGKISSIKWGTFEGQDVRLWRLVNRHGLELHITNWGGRLVKALVPDRNGRLANVTLGWDTLGEYVAEQGGTYYGALVGRYGNRIGKGRFALDGREYTLECTNAPAGIPCALHGGTRGFALRNWTCVREIDEADRTGLVLEIASPDGEGGYPGNVTVRVTLLLTDDNVWHIAWRAETDARTPLSFTQHAYWNLDGVDAGTKVFGHELYLNADHFTPYGPDMIPTGEIREVAHTPFDFRRTRAMGDHTQDPFPEVKYGSGYDMNWVVKKAPADTLTLAAELTSPLTGRRLEVWTTEPGIQVYDGFYLPKPNTGVALETQHFPDSPNKPQFPSTILNPGEVLHTTTQYRFRIV